MASTTALFTGLSGLSANSRRLDVIGNNIANVNTTAYKSNRMTFSPTFSRNFSLGTAPGTGSGGTNPSQVGLGISIAGTQRNMGNGAISATGVATDVAIEGDGMFITRVGQEQLYTRSGAFQRNQNNNLVTISGGRVMGFGVDGNFNIIEGNLVELNVPIGTMTLAEATQNVIFNGNLNASGDAATTGSIHTNSPFYTDAALTTLAASSAFDLTTAGNDLYIDDGAGGSFLAIEGGGRAPSSPSMASKKAAKTSARIRLPSPIPQSREPMISAPRSLISWIFSTMSSAWTILQSAARRSAATSPSTTASSPSPATKAPSKTSISPPAILPRPTTALELRNPLSWVAAAPPMANRFAPASSRTTRLARRSPSISPMFCRKRCRDRARPGRSSPNPLITNPGGALDRIAGLGTVTFDDQGNFISASNNSISLVRTNGAESPLTVDLQMNQTPNAISSLTDVTSNFAAVSQDGSAIGTLSNFSIGEDGRISGSFTNGLTRTIGQLAMAKFSNPEGLVDAGGNSFRVGPNSGTALITTPGSFGTGRVLGGALELSNVDLSQEFISMILASTGYSASSRVITTTKELIDQLMVLGR